MSNEIGEFIRKKRKEAKMTLKEVSENAGISFPYLSTLETGKKTNPSAEVLNSIAGVLGVPPVEILTVAGYLTRDEVEGKVDKKYLQWNLNHLSPLEMLTTIQRPDVIRNIFKSCVKNANLKVDNYELLNVSEEFLVKITSKEYVDLLVIRHKELLHIYVFIAAITQITGIVIPSETIWKWVDNLNGKTDVIEKSLEFDAFDIWYKLYFKDGILDNFGDYELQSTIDYSFDISPVTEYDTILFEGKLLSPSVVKSLRVLLENA
ncbi:helix-turn-helix domain-containing protein [Planococcus maritimus]|uniref:helix-turn-helix domain-containing protein n=1 Tax=Planococcus maritimus TaxID=192421 RepID=UPI003139C312